MRKHLILLGCAALLLLVPACSSPKKPTHEAEVHYILGISFLKEQNPTQALKQLLLAEKADPVRADIQGALAQAYHLKKAYPEAEKHYLRAVELSKKDPQYLNNLGALYIDMKRWDDAIVQFRQAAGNLLFGNPETALIGAAFAYYQQGDYLNSVIACKEALAQNARFAPAYFRLGEAYLAMDKNELAVEAFRQALALDTGSTLARYKLALSYMKNGQTERARESFQDIMRLSPDSEWAGPSGDYLKLLQ